MWEYDARKPNRKYKRALHRLHGFSLWETEFDGRLAKCRYYMQHHRNRVARAWNALGARGQVSMLAQIRKGE